MREEHVPLSAGVAALEQELRRRELCDEICPMAPMAPRTTLRIGGAADLLVTPRSASAALRSRTPSSIKNTSSSRTRAPVTPMGS